MSQMPTPPVKPQPYLMHNQVQNYEWGTRNKDAFIPMLLGFSPKPDTPYGELWMGAHVKAPSLVDVDGLQVPLDQWITAHPHELLGDKVAKAFGHQLPFLLKVLSAGEALSIQAHPNKIQARSLHANSPQHYPDDNHKPEIAVALDKLTALMGIKSIAELTATLRTYPEISKFIGVEVYDKVNVTGESSRQKQRDLVRLLFTVLLTRATTHPLELNAALDQLATRLASATSRRSEADELFLNLRIKYTTADVGLVCLYLMNLVHLEAGQAMFAEAGVPHAYLKGNVVECMANSDNVVRVGLTPKFKDAAALLEIMKYDPGPVTILGGKSRGGTMAYKTPAAEFRVSRFQMTPNVMRHESNDRPLILLVTEGAITLRWDSGVDTFRQGQSLFIPAILHEFSISAIQPSVIFKAETPH